mgnify:FL=1
MVTGPFDPIGAGPDGAGPDGATLEGVGATLAGVRRQRGWFDL